MPHSHALHLLFGSLCPCLQRGHYPIYHSMPHNPPQAEAHLHGLGFLISILNPTLIQTAHLDGRLQIHFEGLCLEAQGGSQQGDGLLLVVGPSQNAAQLRQAPLQSHPQSILHPGICLHPATGLAQVFGDAVEVLCSIYVASICTPPQALLRHLVMHCISWRMWAETGRQLHAGQFLSGCSTL